MTILYLRQYIPKLGGRHDLNRDIRHQPAIADPLPQGYHSPIIGPAHRWQKMISKTRQHPAFSQKESKRHTLLFFHIRGMIRLTFRLSKNDTINWFTALKKQKIRS